MRLRWAPLIFRLLLIVHLENFSLVSIKTSPFPVKTYAGLSFELERATCSCDLATTGTICCFDICKYYFWSIVGPMLYNQQNKIFFQCNSLCFPNTSPTFELQQNKRYCFQILIKHLLIFVQRLPGLCCAPNVNYRPTVQRFAIVGPTYI